MKTKEEIEALANKLYPESEDIIDDIRNGNIRYGFTEGYTQCQQDNKPVDVAAIEKDYYTRAGSGDFQNETDLIDVDAVFNFFKPFLTNTSEDKFALDFVCWLMEFCELQKDSETEENVLWSYDGEDYSMEGLLKLYKDSLPQPPKQTA